MSREPSSSVGSGATFIGIDLGGTSMHAAAVRDGRIVAESRGTTPRGEGQDAVLERVAKLVGKVRRATGDDDPPRGVCVGAPGAVNPATGVVHHAPNLRWTDMPLADELSARIGLPVVVDNDVNVGAIGEHVYGAGRGSRDLAAIFVGTGVGGAVIMDGRARRGFRGAAGEFGHLVAVPDGRVCSCGRRGCFEAYTSRTAIAAMLQERMAEGRASAVPKIMEKKGKTRVTSSVIEAALDRDDALVKEVLAEAQHHLATLVANLVNALDPEVVVFGGGLVERLGTRFTGPIAIAARDGFLQQEGAERVRIVPAELGDRAGPMGAAAVAARRLGG